MKNYLYLIALFTMIALGINSGHGRIRKPINDRNTPFPAADDKPLLNIRLPFHNSFLR